MILGAKDLVGSLVGTSLGLGDGAGLSVGLSLGAPVGLAVCVGALVGTSLGLGLGAGDSVGLSEGAIDTVGFIVGALDKVGASDTDGAAVVGESVGVGNLVPSATISCPRKATDEKGSIPLAPTTSTLLHARHPTIVHSLTMTILVV